jgi:ergothioneine biosynthesis protein EgtB
MIWSTAPAASLSSATATALERYRDVRSATDRLCAPLAAEDYVLQSMPEASPVRWHIAHTTWFFETFFLPRAMRHYRPYDAAYETLFNSYYNAVGEPFPRAQRGLLSRPTVAEVFAYREYVDLHMQALLAAAGEELGAELNEILELGLQHEQQHQELILTDLKHALSVNPLHPVYRPRDDKPRAEADVSVNWIPFEAGIYAIGHDGAGFAFDNERPRHRVFLEPFALASRLVTNAEYLAFMEDGGYERPELWLAEGWNLVTTQGWDSPLYWRLGDDGWEQFTLAGLRQLDPDEPVCHVSYFEADAYARWCDARLPTEAEWEVAAATAGVEGNFVESNRLHPRPLSVQQTYAAPRANASARRFVFHDERNDAPAGILAPGDIAQLYGDVWEWTGSAYLPYPGYRPLPGALGEYNGKFMCNQFVLRGGSCATPRSHIRASYRNFFPPAARWQFTGLRLAKS